MSGVMDEKTKKHVQIALGIAGAVGVIALLVRPKRASARPTRDWGREYSEYSQPPERDWSREYNEYSQRVDPALDPNIDRELDPESPETVPDPDKPVGGGRGFPSSYDLGYRYPTTAPDLDLRPYGPPQPQTYEQPPAQDYNYPTPPQPMSFTTEQDDEITSRGNQTVARYQQRLQTLGYDPGPIDGRFGRLTRNAVTDFQRDHGLTPDGILGPQTKNAIDAAYSGGASRSSGSTSSASSYSAPRTTTTAASKSIATSYAKQPTSTISKNVKSLGDLGPIRRGDNRYMWF